MKPAIDQTNQVQPELLKQLALGRHVANMSLFSWLAAGVFLVKAPPLIFALYFVAFTMAAVIGTTRLTHGLRFSGLKRFIAVVSSAVPVVGWLVMGWLSGRASKVLEASGYRVGLFQSTNGEA